MRKKSVPLHKNVKKLQRIVENQHDINKKKLFFFFIVYNHFDFVVTCSKTVGGNLCHIQVNIYIYILAEYD